jgi:hypothetical protein
MMNIQMLVWGVQHVDSPARDLRMDADPAATWMSMAQEHARQVAKNHVRPDGSTYHIVEYNPNTGVICTADAQFCVFWRTACRLDYEQAAAQ